MYLIKYSMNGVQIQATGGVTIQLQLLGETCSRDSQATGSRLVNTEITYTSINFVPNLIAF